MSNLQHIGRGSRSAGVTVQANAISTTSASDRDGVPQHLEVTVSNLATECLAVDFAEYQLTVMKKLTGETWLRGFIRN